jgi:hypothetical protein
MRAVRTERAKASARNRRISPRSGYGFSHTSAGTLVCSQGGSSPGADGGHLVVVLPPNTLPIQQ